MRLSRVHLAAAVVAAYVLAAPSTAIAGAYEVSLCTRADYAALPTDGWAPFNLFGAGSTQDLCANQSGGRYLATTLAANTRIENGEHVGWSFTAPPGTTIGSYTLWRSVRPAHAWTSEGRWSHAYCAVGGCASPVGRDLRCRGLRRARLPTMLAARKSERAVFRCEPCERSERGGQAPLRAHGVRRGGAGLSPARKPRAASDIRRANPADRRPLSGPHPCPCRIAPRYDRSHRGRAVDQLRGS